ncbi:MAG: prolipoprotein diacylglyceryl transferase [Eubacteriales bacterium]|nr:prolipoprotein diacylglyceryl transferase [Eubacteriales bacterium]
MKHNIAFPKLGLDFEINRIAFSVFGKPIYWYAIIIVTGFLLAAAFVARSAKKRGINPENIWDIALYGLVFGLVGARIYYVIFDFDTIRDNFWNIFKVWEGGLAIYGAIIAAVITAYVYSKRHKLPVLRIFDLCCQGLFIGQSIGRWGNFVNAEVYGGETSLLWGMSIDGANPVHPLFLYESLWNALGFIIVLFIRDRIKTDGKVFSFYILWYSFGRLLLEGMRQSEYILYLAGNVGISQVVAGIGILVGISGLVFLGKRSQRVEVSDNETESQN